MDTITSSDFINVLLGFRAVRDASGALEFYREVNHRSPELIDVKALQALLTVLKFSPELAMVGIDLYCDALKDTVRFPNLSTDAMAVMAANALLMGADATLSDGLTKALKFKDSLYEQGVTVDTAVYASLLILSAKYKDFKVTKAIYEESLQHGLVPTLAMEAALLQTAVHMDEYDECEVIFNRIVTEEHLGLNVKVVESMLEYCRKRQMSDMCVEMANKWMEYGGKYTWSMCESILCTLLTPEQLELVAMFGQDAWRQEEPVLPASDHAERHVEENPTNASTATENPTKKSPGYRKRPPVDVLAVQRETRLIHSIMYQALDALYNFQRLNAQHMDVGLVGPNKRPISDQINAHVPIGVLAPLAGIIAARGEADLVFQRLDSSLSSHSLSTQRREHRAVLNAMARDLAMLGKGRELLGLSARMNSYIVAADADPLHYTKEELDTLHLYTALGLMRCKQHARADEFIEKVLAPRSRENSAWIAAVLADVPSASRKVPVKFGNRSSPAKFKELWHLEQRIAAFCPPPSV